MVFTEIDATEYLDDLWGPHMHLHITKTDKQCILFRAKLWQGKVWQSFFH